MDGKRTKPKRFIISLNFLLFLTVAISVTTFAHPGRTDANGGHYNRKTGEYHYHNSGNDGSSSSSDFTQSDPTSTPKPTPTYTPSPTPKPIIVSIDNEQVKFDTPPQIINDRVMVQIRTIAVKLGCKVEWDSNTQTCYINQASIPIKKSAKKSENINVFVNNKQISFPDQNPMIIDGNLLMPCRSVIEALGHSVEWNATSQTQKITTK